MTEFTQNAGLEKVLKKVMEDTSKHELDGIREQELKVDCFVKIKTNSEGDSQPCGGAPAKVQKVSGLWVNYADANYILVMDNYFFTHCEDNDIEGMIFDALQTIDVKIVKGEIKLAKKRPDVECFASTIRYYGPINEALKALKESFKTAATNFVSKIAPGTLPEEEPATSEPTEAEAPTEPEEVPKRRGGRNR